MEYQDKVVIVTGGAQGIGKCIAEEFRKQGALVEVIDKQEGLDHFVGDLSNKYAIEEFTKLVIEKYGKVDFIVNNALPLMKGIDECSYEEFEYALKVGVTAPFYMVKLLKDHLAEGASIVNISSSRDRMSQPQTESYTQRKAVLQHSHMPLPSVLQARLVSIPSLLDGSIRTIKCMRVPMPTSNRQAESAILSTLPTWYFSSVPKRQVSSQAKTSA